MDTLCAILLSSLLRLDSDSVEPGLSSSGNGYMLPEASTLGFLDNVQAPTDSVKSNAGRGSTSNAAVANLQAVDKSDVASTSTLTSEIPLPGSNTTTNTIVSPSKVHPVVNI